MARAAMTKRGNLLLDELPSIVKPWTDFRAEQFRLTVRAIEREAAQQERERMRAMRSDFQNLPHREFPAKWPDWREYEDVLPTYCSCQECRLWRSGS